MARDPRDARDEMRKHVMELARELGADRVPPGLLDDLVKIYLEKGRRAAEAHFAERRNKLRAPPNEGCRFGR